MLFWVESRARAGSEELPPGANTLFDTSIPITWGDAGANGKRTSR